MSLNALPTETLSRIFTFLGDRPGDDEDAVDADLATLGSLCLVSKRLHPLAERHLYRAPIPRDWSRASWEIASSLLRSVSAQRGRRGHDVRSLRGICAFVAQLSLDHHPTAHEDSRQTYEGRHDAFAWYTAMLTWCPCLRLVEVFNCLGSHESALVAGALRRSASTLQEMDFLTPWYLTHSERDCISGVSSILSTLDIPALRTVLVHDHQHATPRPGYDAPSLGLQRLKSLVIRARVPLAVELFKALLPIEADSLKAIRLRLSPDEDEDEDVMLPELVSLFPVTTRNLDIELLREKRDLHLSLLPQSFDSLPRLALIRLGGFEMPVLAVLAHLASNNPRLRSIVLDDISWIPDPSRPDEPIFDATDLVQVLRSFRRLKRCDLDVLPISASDSLDPLVALWEEGKLGLFWTVDDE